MATNYWSDTYKLIKVSPVWKKQRHLIIVDNSSGDLDVDINRENLEIVHYPSARKYGNSKSISNLEDISLLFFGRRSGGNNGMHVSRYDSRKNRTEDKGYRGIKLRSV